MIRTPQELKTYFQALATELGCSFEYGNSERILNRQKDQLIYPLIWLEVPAVRRDRSTGGLTLEMEAAFICLDNREPDDYAGQDAALDAMLTLTEQILQRLQTDSEAQPSPFLFDMAGAVSEHKFKWSADDDWGWRTEFEITGAACESADCCDD